jgi:heme/copper-type cytochrome/quinol oxidase subunit 2
MIDPIIATAIFLLICGIATCLIVYTCLMYRKKKIKTNKKETNLRRQIENILAIITVIIYLGISFITMAWYITWIIWLVFALVTQIIKLIFILRGDSNEK